MLISEDNPKRLVVKLTPRHTGWIFAGGYILMVLVVFAIAGASGAEPRGGGTSRTPNGGPILVLLVGAPVMIFFDWRRNRKSLTFDSETKTVTIVGRPNREIRADEIESFLMGSALAVSKQVSAIDIQLKTGERFGTGINSSFGSAEVMEEAMKKLGERLKAARLN